jgi:K+-transporting ATPase ATPase C chain
MQTQPKTHGIFRQMIGHIGISIIATVVLVILTCGIYPLIVYGIAQIPGLKAKADGSFIYATDGTTIVGSRLIGQSFSDEKYFHPRPSAAGTGYDPTSTGGSNLGPTSARLINGATKAGPTTQSATTVVDYDGIKLRTVLYAQDNGIAILDASQPLASFQDAHGVYDQVKLITAFNDANTPLTFHTAVPIPADAVTASASGVDPHISVDNARIQSARVAKIRGISLGQVLQLVDENTDPRDLGIFGEAGVNVVALNYALDHLK